MKKELFNDLLQSVTEAVAIKRGERKPSRKFRVEGKEGIPNVFTARTLKASKAGRNVKRFRSKRELFAGLDL